MKISCSLVGLRDDLRVMGVVSVSADTSKGAEVSGCGSSEDSRLWEICNSLRWTREDKGVKWLGLMEL